MQTSLCPPTFNAFRENHDTLGPHGMYDVGSGMYDVGSEACLCRGTVGAHPSEALYNGWAQATVHTPPNNRLWHVLQTSQIIPDTKSNELAHSCNTHRLQI